MSGLVRSLPKCTVQSITWLFPERVCASGGWRSRASTITRWGPSPRRWASSLSTTTSERSEWSGASPPGPCSTGWRWWATRLSPVGTTWPGSRGTTRRSSCGLCTKTRRSGKTVQSEMKEWGNKKMSFPNYRCTSMYKPLRIAAVMNVSFYGYTLKADACLWSLALD